MSDIHNLFIKCPHCPFNLHGQSPEDQDKVCLNTNCPGRLRARGLAPEETVSDVPQSAMRLCAACHNPLVFSVPQEAYCPNEECPRYLRTQ